MQPQRRYEIATAPTVFTQGTREVVAIATRGGTILVLDAADVGGGNHATPLGRFNWPARTAVPSRAALTTWKDGAGTRWLALPATNRLVTLKVVPGVRVLAFEAGWTSGPMQAPLTHLVVNGVLFAAASGEVVPPEGTIAGVAERIRQSRPARIYAIDASTGRELWNSGAQITSFAHGPAFWTSIGQVHLATYDSTVYTFGFAMERH